MSERFTGIAFGTGPIGYREGLNEEKIREVVEKIDQETKEAGLPWWAGLFNPKIVELAEIERKECKCAEQKVSVTAREEEKLREKNQKLREERDELRAEWSKKIELYNQADEKCMSALEAMEAGMEKLQTAIVENDLSYEQLGNLTDGLAKLGSAMSMLRMNMGFQSHPYGMSMNNCFCPPGNE